MFRRPALDAGSRRNVNGKQGCLWFAQLLDPASSAGRRH